MTTTINWSALIRSAAFWSALAGLSGMICGALGVGGLAKPIATVLVAIGGVLVAIPASHVTAKQQAVAAAKARAAIKHG